jgi:hypothetical protein
LAKNPTSAPVTTTTAAENLSEEEQEDKTGDVPTDNDVLEGVDLFADDPEDFNIDNTLLEVRLLVAKARKLCKFMKNSTLTQGKFGEFHKDSVKVYDKLV